MPRRKYPPVAYRLPDGSTYCPGCIVSAYLRSNSTVAGIGEDFITGDPEDDLAHIANTFGFDPTLKHDVEEWGYPIPLQGPPRTFCDTCMRWFK